MAVPQGGDIGEVIGGEPRFIGILGSLTEEEQVAACEPRSWVSCPVKEGEVNFVESWGTIGRIRQGGHVLDFGRSRLWLQEPEATKLRRALPFTPEEGQILRALLLRRIGELALELLERLGDGLEGGAVLGTFSPRGLIFNREAGESRDHGVMVFLLFGGEFF
jgi:hypothetical protein